VTQVKKPDAPKPEEALPTPAPPRDKNN